MICSSLFSESRWVSSGTLRIAALSTLDFPKDFFTFFFQIFFQNFQEFFFRIFCDFFSEFFKTFFFRIFQTFFFQNFSNFFRRIWELTFFGVSEVWVEPQDLWTPQILISHNLQVFFFFKISLSPFFCFGRVVQRAPPTAKRYQVTVAILAQGKPSG